jgi:uncharacterized protein YcbK (DUF882 family)
MPSPYRLRLLDAHTGATFNGVYRDSKGPIARVMDELCIFLRDQHSGWMTNMDVGVIDFLASVMTATSQTNAIVLSGFRSLETNEMLARTTFGVAENSQHIYGRALDVQFPTKLPEAMATARAMKRGGVGWYPRSGFMHLDSGPVRSWNLESGGLQELLIAPAATPHSPTPRGEMLVNGPGRIVIGSGRTPLVLTGRVSLKVH